MKKRMSPIQVAVIGCGKITQWVHIKNLIGLKNVRVVALADSDPKEAAKVKAFAPQATVYSDPAEVLALPHVEAVLICLPNLLHAGAAKQALQKGKHVYLEKPLAVNLTEAAELLQIAETAGRVAMIGFNFRFNSLFLNLKSLINAGAAGEIAAARTVFSSSAKRQVPLWKQKSATGGGVLLDLALHHFDLLTFLFASKVHEISARIWSQKYEEDNAFVQWRLENGLRIESFYTFNSADEDRIELHAEKGNFSADRFRPTGFLQKILNSGYEPSYKVALSRFFESIRLDRPASPSFSDGYEALLAVHAARLSHEKKASVLLKDLRFENFAHQ